MHSCILQTFLYLRFPGQLGLQHGLDPFDDLRLLVGIALLQGQASTHVRYLSPQSFYKIAFQRNLTMSTRMLSSLSASLSASNGVVQALRRECLTVCVWVWTRGRFQIRSSFLNTRGGGARSSAAFICCPWKLRMSLPTNLCPYLLQRDAVNVWLVFVPYINLLWPPDRVKADWLTGYWIAVFHSFISLERSF